MFLINFADDWYQGKLAIVSFLILFHRAAFQDNSTLQFDMTRKNKESKNQPITESATAQTAQPPNFWEGDLLERKEVARYLTTYLARRYQAKPHENGFVLAINADWGFGKSFLMNKWKDELNHLGYPAIYFDAWQNDFTPEPLIAFIAELDEALKPLYREIPAAERIVKSGLEKISLVWRPVVTTVLKHVLKKGTGVVYEEVEELVSDAEVEPSADNTDGFAGREQLHADLHAAYEKALENHNDKKAAITAFKAGLNMLIKALESESSHQLPIFFFVDELDRCRPDYAIALLEGIKHLFGVPGIYFVVATNLNQLSESTKAIYGPGFDGQRYLKRFFDLEYTLPEPSHEAFARSLFQNMALPQTAQFVTGFDQIVSIREENVIPLIYSKYMQFFNCGLRDQQQIIKIVEAAFVALSSKRIHVHYLFFLAALYQRSPQVFERVIALRSLHEKTGFEDLVNHPGASQIKFETVDLVSSFDTSRRDKATPIQDVASLYLKHAWTDASQIETQGINSYDFPKNLLHSLRQETLSVTRGNEQYPLSVRRYPEIIKFSGGFLDPRSES